MTQYEMTEALSTKMNVTMEEARAALEQGEWNMLTATQLLEQAWFQKKQALNMAAAAATAVQTAPEEAEQPCEAVQAEPAAQAARAEPAAQAARAEPAAQAGRQRARREEKARRDEKCRRGLRNVGEHIRRLVACGNRNRFEVRRGDELVMDLPVTVLAVALIFAFWVCLPLLVVGLFTGWRYSFSGAELGSERINGAMRKAAEVAGGR